MSHIKFSLLLVDALPDDAAKKDPEAFKIWREDPANFSWGGRYPLREVYDKATDAWKGVSGSVLPSQHMLCCLHSTCSMLQAIQLLKSSWVERKISNCYLKQITDNSLRETSMTSLLTSPFRCQRCNGASLLSVCCDCCCCLGAITSRKSLLTLLLYCAPCSSSLQHADSTMHNRP